MHEFTIEHRALEQFLRTRADEDFYVLFEAVYGRLCRYFTLRGLDAMLAEDLAQNVMLNVHQHIGALRDPALFLGWLFAIARREVGHHWQHRARRQPLEAESLSAEMAESFALEPVALSDLRWRDWMRALEPAERDLATLAFIEELTYEELAAVFAIPLGTVKWRIYKLRKKLIEIVDATTPARAHQRIN